MHNLDPLLKLSQKLGQSIEQVQGPGGNTSVKFKDKMFVKASGHTLKEMRMGHGYVCCLHKDVLGHLRRNQKESVDKEALLNTLIEEVSVKDESFGVASIETAMHAVLQSKYVAHTHNVYVNVFSCMKGGREILQEILGDTFLYVPYANPGYYLARLLDERTRSTSDVPSIIILENHGIIVHHEGPDYILKTIQDINKSVSSYLKKRGVSKFAILRSEFSGEKHLFPDTAVYGNVDFSMLSKSKLDAYHEIMSAHAYILESIGLFGGVPRYIAHKHVDYIQNND